MSFSRMTSAVSHLLPKMIEHPFNRALSQGTLPKKVFRFYLEQDSLYLKDFAKALKVTSKRFDSQSEAQAFEVLSEKMLASERKMQKQYLGDLDSATLFTQPRNIEKIPILKDYTDHLFQAVHLQSLEEAVASLVPCFWIYNQLGQTIKIAADEHTNHPYQRWIASYSSDHFNASVKSIVQISELLGNNILCAEKNEKMIAAFVKSTEYEIKFLDSISMYNEKSTFSRLREKVLSKGG